MYSYDQKAEYYAGALPDGLGIRYDFKREVKQSLAEAQKVVRLRGGIIFFPTLATSNSTDCSSCFGMILLPQAVLQSTSTLRKLCQTSSRLFLLLLIAALHTGLLCHCFCRQVKKSVCLALRLSLESLNSSCETTLGFQESDETCHPVICRLKLLSGAWIQPSLFLARFQLEIQENLCLFFVR